MEHFNAPERAIKLEGGDTQGFSINRFQEKVNGVSRNLKAALPE
jgi:hypothetical protein